MLAKLLVFIQKPLRQSCVLATPKFWGWPASPRSITPRSQGLSKPGGMKSHPPSSNVPLHHTSLPLQPMFLPVWYVSSHVAFPHAFSFGLLNMGKRLKKKKNFNGENSVTILLLFLVYWHLFTYCTQILIYVIFLAHRTLVSVFFFCNLIMHLAAKEYEDYLWNFDRREAKKNHSYRWRQNLNNGIQKFERQSMCPYTKEKKCIPMLG